MLSAGGVRRCAGGDDRCAARDLFKDLFDRARPPVADPGLDPVGIVPASASFPSGHAATAFAAAVAVALVYPRLGRPLLALAVVIAVSRVYLGVHYVLDVAVGTLLGIAVGVAAAWVIRAGCTSAQRTRSESLPVLNELSFSP